MEGFISLKVTEADAIVVSPSSEEETVGFAKQVSEFSARERREKSE